MSLLPTHQRVREHRAYGSKDEGHGESGDEEYEEEFDSEEDDLE